MEENDKIVEEISLWFNNNSVMSSEDWDNILELAIRKFENASNAQEYRNAVSEMTAYTHDSHVWVNWPSKDRAHPMFVCRYIENKLIATRFLSDSRKNTIMLGDEIISIDDIHNIFRGFDLKDTTVFLDYLKLKIDKKHLTEEGCREIINIAMKMNSQNRENWRIKLNR